MVARNRRLRRLEVGMPKFRTSPRTRRSWAGMPVDGNGTPVRRVVETPNAAGHRARKAAARAESPAWRRPVVR